jgi:hypothetical protein
MGQQNPAPPKGWLKAQQNHWMFTKPPFSTGDNRISLALSTDDSTGIKMLFF